MKVIFSKRTKKALWFSVSVVGISLYFLVMLFFPLHSATSDESSFVYVYENTTLEQVSDSVAAKTSAIAFFFFKQAAPLLGFDKVHTGRYEIKTGMSNFTLIRNLKAGRQKPLMLTFNNIRTKEQLAGRLSKLIMADSISIISLLNDTSFLSPKGFNPQTSKAVFIPDTYEVFWNITAEDLFDRMLKEYSKFWTNERRQKAALIPLTPIEVATLASIVEEESNSQRERPKIAGLYINRLKKNMPLQADPTLKFAVGDFSIKRLRFGHIRRNSPYNTYLNTGLPPGPIRVASAKGIDAVLNYDKHNFIFMCANENFDGEHNFAVTYADHLVNARRYQKALDARNIK